MALVLADRVRDTTATTGTGTVTLSGTAPTGYQNFSVIGNGNTTYYTINSDTQWEVGVGTYTSSGTTLARNTVLASSSGGSLVDFAAGTKDVFVTYPSEKAVTEDYGNALAATTAANLAGGAAGSIPYQTAANTTAMLATGTGVLIGGTTPSYTMSPSLTQVTVAGDPTTNFQVATKQYVDTQTSSGIHYHEPVRVESPINLNATYNNGTAGVGATLTNAGTQVALVIDGVTLSVADRVLVYEQTDETQNGIYVVTSVGSGSTNWVLTRSSDADTYVNASPDGLSEGSTVFVQQGTTGAGETYTCNTTGTIVFGTTAITFAQISSAQIYSAGTGLTLTGTTFSLTSPVATTLGGTGLTSFTTGGAVYATSSSVLTTGTLPATAGGTGQSSYTAGDLLYATSSTTLGVIADVATGNALISGGAGADPSYGKIGLTTHITGTLAVGNGGTGATSLTGYLVGNGTSAFTATTTIPTSDLSGTISLTTQVSGTLGAGNGGTGISSYTVGDILYASGTTALSSLPDVATGNALISGGVSNAPLWGKIGLTTHVSGTLPVSNGGSGATTLTGYLKGNGTSAFTASATIPSGDITGAALTKADDTNVTLTLGGSPSTALLAATSITAGWSGQLAVSRGGTGNSTLASGYLLKGNGVSPTSASVIYDSGTSIGINTSSPSEEIEAFGTDASIIVHYSGQSRGGISALSGARIALTTTTSGDDLVFGYAGSPITSAGFVPRMTIDNGTGSITAGVDFRAPIFYDSNDTSYYVDPSANSIMGGVYGRGQLRATGWWGSQSASGTGLGIEIGQSGGRGYVLSYNRDAATYGPMSFEANDFLFTGVSGGFVATNNSFRAPIFYDSDNTGYYLNPNGSSLLNTVNIDTLLNVSNGASLFLSSASAAYQRVDSRNEGSDARAHWYGVTTAGATSNFRHAWYDGAAYFNVTASSSQVVFERTAGTGSLVSAGDMRSPIFYDSNNTNFYIDAASNSILNTLTLGNRATTNAVFYSGFTLDANTMLTNSTGFTYAVNAPFTGPIARLGGHGGYDLWFNAPYGGGGRLAFRTQNGDTGAFNSWQYPALYDQNVNGGGALYASIYYDQNNTSFYVNPESTSVIWETRSYYLTNIAAVSDNHDFGVYFSNDRSTAYAIYREPGAWNFPFPDLRIAFHTGIKMGANASYNGMRFYTDNDMSTQVMSINNGSDGLGAANVFVNNSLQAASSLRAPIFYDSNNTGYYVDPASTSVLNSTTIAGTYGRTAAGVGYLNGGYNGAETNGTTGPIYCISPVFAPSSTALVSMYGIGYTDGGSSGVWSGGGWGLYVAAAGGARHFLDGNSGIGYATGSYRAPIFYDQNNTSYYLDPAGTSVLNYVGVQQGNGVNFNGAGSTVIKGTGGDGANSTTANLKIQSWFGIGFGPTISGQPIPIDENAVFIDCRSGDLTARGNVTAYSDIRVKKDVETIGDALGLVGKMRGVRYTRIDSGRRGVGVIAQEVLEVVPEVVQREDDENGALSVAYGNLVGVLIEAIKELEARVAELEGK